MNEEGFLNPDGSRTLFLPSGEDEYYGGDFVLVQPSNDRRGLLFSVGFEYGQYVTRDDARRLRDVLDQWLNGSLKSPPPIHIKKDISVEEMIATLSAAGKKHGVKRIVLEKIDNGEYTVYLMVSPGTPFNELAEIQSDCVGTKHTRFTLLDEDLPLGELADKYSMGRVWEVPL